MDYSTSRKGGTTDSLRDARISGWAFNAGVEKGIVLGMLMALTPDEKNRGVFRQNEIAARLCEYARNAEQLIAVRKYGSYWPAVMPGGWPLPPPIPSDDESTYWPEVDGWPCPPPALRGTV